MLKVCYFLLYDNLYKVVQANTTVAITPSTDKYKDKYSPIGIASDKLRITLIGEFGNLSAEYLIIESVIGINTAGKIHEIKRIKTIHLVLVCINPYQLLPQLFYALASYSNSSCLFTPEADPFTTQIAPLGKSETASNILKLPASDPLDFSTISRR